MPQNLFYEIEAPFCCSRKTHATAEQKPYAATCHYHNAFEIYLFLSGKASMYYDETYYPMNPGDLYIISPNKPHGAACYEAKVYDRLVINISEEFLKELSNNDTNLNAYLPDANSMEIRVIHLDSKSQKRLIQLVEEFGDFELQQSGYGTELEARARATILMVTLNRLIAEHSEQTGKKSQPALITGIIDYVTEHLTEPITLNDLATNFFISSKYISSVFHKQMGMTLREYVITQRVECAKKLLSEGKNVSEACELSGFGDYANFIRTFTQVSGISPGKYARMQRNEE